MVLLIGILTTGNRGMTIPFDRTKKHVLTVAHMIRIWIWPKKLVSIDLIPNINDYFFLVFPSPLLIRRANVVGSITFLIEHDHDETHKFDRKIHIFDGTNINRKHSLIWVH
jgi:hypothetical protein